MPKSFSLSPERSEEIAFLSWPRVRGDDKLKS
jgi:hypothetical protein